MAGERTTTPPTRKPVLGARVDTLETQVARLEKTTQQLRRDQSATRRHLRDLAKVVDSILPNVRTELEAQTVTINEHVDERLDETRTFVLATVVDLARQWPAAAIVAVTSIATLAAGVLVNWVLAAQHLPHIH